MNFVMLRAFNDEMSKIATSKPRCFRGAKGKDIPLALIKGAGNPFMKPVRKGVTMAAEAVKKFRSAGLKRGVAGGLKGGYRKIKPPPAK